MGPCIVTADEIPYPPILDVKCYVNGQLRQSNSTGNLIFGISHIISELSSGMTLLPGTIISTGTPSGVGFAMDPPQRLKCGDMVSCEIEGIGKLTNVVF
jgi:2-keto-4-pentenoate hydratase/2-oxohepta-3-ene-1,7-dioic acid hydratase in catechol pathway